MTDKEIVQALRCMATRDERRDCEIAKRSQLGCAECTSSYIRDAAAAIERLTAENTKAEAERDALLEYAKLFTGCDTCKHSNYCKTDSECNACAQDVKGNCYCKDCERGSRGLRRRPARPAGAARVRIGHRV